MIMAKQSPLSTPTPAEPESQAQPLQPKQSRKDQHRERVRSVADLGRQRRKNKMGYIVSDRDILIEMFEVICDILIDHLPSPVELTSTGFIKSSGVDA